MGMERVTKVLKTPPKAARSGPKSTSLSQTTLSDAVEEVLQSSETFAAPKVTSGCLVGTYAPESETREIGGK